MFFHRQGGTPTIGLLARRGRAMDARRNNFDINVGNTACI